MSCVVSFTLFHMILRAECNGVNWNVL